jgi:hypothetical protein
MPSSQYRNVFPHKNMWRATGYWHGKTFWLGYWRSEMMAAWVADFASYILYGVDVAQWHHLAKKPNFLPTVRKIVGSEKQGDMIVRKLLDKGYISSELARARLADYDRVAEALLPK